MSMNFFISTCISLMQIQYFHWLLFVKVGHLRLLGEYNHVARSTFVEFVVATLNIAGNTINAQSIDHYILRKPEESLVKDVITLYQKSFKCLTEGGLKRGSDFQSFFMNLRFSIKLLRLN